MPAVAVEMIRRGELELALHRWIPDEARSAVVYIHGVQSHAGWLFETGPELARRGVALYALDRRGSGQSAGARGDVGSFREWLDDYRAVLEIARQRTQGHPVILVGQSLGGSIAAALACEAAPDALLLGAPALGQRHARLPESERAGATQRATGRRVPVPLEDRAYTRDPRYLDFMANDARMVREITDRTLAAMNETEAVYLRSTPWTFPSALVLPREDRIVDLTVARDVYRRLAGNRGMVIELPADDHYLEFSAAREAFWDLIAVFSQGRGVRLSRTDHP